ncbi:MAG: DNA repair protein RecN [Flavobacteriales bacterium]|nr:DNA repair protein RecN [Flavobacteriales bacterium]MCB9448012.1 DNA repair protein RecN [Flavobacteriales bacterium]
MLQHLSIRNYALIDELDLSFGEGLTVITGETGAGKSILLGALSLILGQRADTQVLLNPDMKCTVEGHFRIGHLSLESFFESEGLDYEPETILRREINTSGKSRAFINDTPVTLAQMKTLGSFLVDIHSQHHNLLIGKADFQTTMLDSYAANETVLKTYRKAFDAFRKAEAAWNNFRNDFDSSFDEDYVRFQLNELQEAKLVEGEEEALEKELNLIANAGDIKSRLSQVNDLLNGDDQSICGGLSQIAAHLHKLSGQHEAIAHLADRIQSTLIELRDIQDAVEDLEQKTEADPEREEEVIRRLDLLRHLQQKHRVTDIGALQQLEEKFRKMLTEWEGREEAEKQLQEELRNKREEAFAVAKKLSMSRSKAIPALQKEVETLLAQLKMPDARLAIQLQSADEHGLTTSGVDAIRFLFSANKGGQPVEIAKAASGGELSRLMLAIKSILSSRLNLPTIIFDEIDTGISGEVADLAGRIMEEMGQNMQVVAVTHLPQIAGKGLHHLEVYKENQGASTATRIRPLDTEARVMAIARMLSGSQTTDAAVENAKVLLVKDRK